MTPFGLKTLHHKYHGNGAAPLHFQSLSDIFASNLLKRMSSLVWDSYFRCKPRLVEVFTKYDELLQIERSITQVLSDDIVNNFPIEAPFSFQQNRDEFESLKTPKAQPPQYDMAFFLKSDSRVSWPMEAKVLASPTTLGEYIKDIHESFLTGKYAPYSDSAAMIGYLREPDAPICKDEIATKLKVALDSFEVSAKYSHWVSDHQRPLPIDPTITQDFRCHHLIFELY